MGEKILIIGSPSFTGTIRVVLQQLGYQCTEAEGSVSPGPRQPEVVIVVMRPFAARGQIASLRQSLGQVPVLAVTTPHVALTLSGDDRPDDFVLPAHAPGELNARLQRLMKKKAEAAPATPEPAAPGQVIRAGELEINRATFQVFVRGRAVDLALREYQLLAFLASNPGRAFTRAELLERVWGADYLGGTRTVDVHVRRIREKLAACEREMLVTVRGVGYRFELPGESQ